VLIYIFDVFILSVSSKLINLLFQAFPLLVPESSTDFTSYIVQSISICLVLILKLLKFRLVQ
jgi:hypothetical protein